MNIFLTLYKSLTHCTHSLHSLTAPNALISLTQTFLSLSLSLLTASPSPSRPSHQIDEECQKFAQCTNIRARSIVGGMSIQEQSMMLRDGLEVLVGTPGRIVDCLDSRFLVLNQVCAVDENTAGPVGTQD